MNIGIFTDTYYPQINGLVTSLNMLEEEMTKRGHKFYIFTTSNPGDYEKRPNVIRLPSISFKMSPSHRVAILYPPRLLLGMRKFKLDVIHTQSEFPLGIFGRLVSEFYSKPLIHTYHTLWEEYVHYFGNSRIITKEAARGYSRIFCNGADAIIAPTEKTKHILEGYGVKKPMAVIPTGIDFEPFSPKRFSAREIIELRRSFGIDDKAPVLVTVARIAGEKSIDKVIVKIPELTKVLPNLKYVIVGDGPALQSLKDLAAEIGAEGSVIFTGARPWSEIGKYYQMGSIFINASTSETQGLTYVESMAAGLIPVARYDKSIEDIVIDGKTGFYFNHEDEIPQTILKALLTDDGQKSLMKARARDIIEPLSSERFADNVEAFYTETIDNFNEKRKERWDRIRHPLGFFKARK
jgi:1,2-diacylglycerol 3-alpha-glucosyltransferase